MNWKYISWLIKLFFYDDKLIANCLSDEAIKEHLDQLKTTWLYTKNNVADFPLLNAINYVIDRIYRLCPNQPNSFKEFYSAVFKNNNPEIIKPLSHSSIEAKFNLIAQLATCETNDADHTILAENLLLAFGKVHQLMKFFNKLPNAVNSLLALPSHHQVKSEDEQSEARFKRWINILEKEADETLLVKLIEYNKCYGYGIPKSIEEAHEFASLEEVVRIYGEKAKDDQQFAKTCKKYKVGEKVFNAAMDVPLKVKDIIPNIEIIDEKTGYKVSKLSPSDRTGLILGYIVDNCQSILNPGGNFAHYGATTETSCFFVVTSKHNNIVAEMWAWVARDGKSIVLDSFESIINDESRQFCLRIVAKLFQALQAEGFDVYLGDGGRTPKLPFPIRLNIESPRIEFPGRFFPYDSFGLYNLSQAFQACPLHLMDAPLEKTKEYLLEADKTSITPRILTFLVTLYLYDESSLLELIELIAKLFPNLLGDIYIHERPLLAHLISSYEKQPARNKDLIKAVLRCGNITIREPWVNIRETAFKLSLSASRNETDKTINHALANNDYETIDDVFSHDVDISQLTFSIEFLMWVCLGQEPPRIEAAKKIYASKRGPLSIELNNVGAAGLLWLACQYDEELACNLLREPFIDVNVHAQNGPSALFCAVHSGFDQAVALILSKANAKINDFFHSETSLSIACRKYKSDPQKYGKILQSFSLRKDLNLSRWHDLSALSSIKDIEIALPLIKRSVKVIMDEFYKKEQPPTFDSPLNLCSEIKYNLEFCLYWFNNPEKEFIFKDDLSPLRTMMKYTPFEELIFSGNNFFPVLLSLHLKDKSGNLNQRELQALHALFEKLSCFSENDEQKSLSSFWNSQPKYTKLNLTAIIELSNIILERFTLTKADIIMVLKNASKTNVPELYTIWYEMYLREAATPDPQLLEELFTKQAGNASEYFGLQLLNSTKTPARKLVLFWQSATYKGYHELSTKCAEILSHKIRENENNYKALEPILLSFDQVGFYHESLDAVLNTLAQHNLLNQKIRGELTLFNWIALSSRNCNELLQNLVMRGADPNATNQHGKAILHQLEHSERHCRQLLLLGVDPTIKNPEGELASYDNLVKAVEYCVENEKFEDDPVLHRKCQEYLDAVKTKKVLRI